MKITTKNYFSAIKKIGEENLPAVLLQSHELISTKTNEGKDWALYKSDAGLKRMIDLAFEKLEEFMERDKEGLAGIKGKLKNPDNIPMEPLFLMDAPFKAKVDIMAFDAAMDYMCIWKLNNLNKKIPFELQWKVFYRPVEAEIRSNALRIFAIDGKIINKYVEIRDLEKYFQKKYNVNTYRFKYVMDAWRYIPDKLRTPNFKPFEVDFVYRFIYFNNKTVLRKEIHDYLEDLQDAILSKKIRKTSSLAAEIMEIQKLLIPTYNKSKANTLKIVFKKATEKRFRKSIGYDEPKQLFKAFIYEGEQRNITHLSGIQNTTEIPKEKVNIMSSTDFANLKFNTIGFKDKWLAFIGDPAPGFTAMVFGMPKMGKSYLCVDFAGYLARNHGKVLYVAKEEKLDKTLQDKLKDKNVAHENLFVADALPVDLSMYDFIFLDSVNKLGLSPQDLNQLRNNNKGKSFIFVFQATKEGKFKGNNEFQHDVDVVIEVPEQGKAVQFGRFNQGVEMEIFDKTVQN